VNFEHVSSRLQHDHEVGSMLKGKTRPSSHSSAAALSEK